MGLRGLLCACLGGISFGIFDVWILGACQVGAAGEVVVVEMVWLSIDRRVLSVANLSRVTVFAPYCSIQCVAPPAPSIRL